MGREFPRILPTAWVKTYISRKQGGLGLGVLLSQSSIERLGGEVSMIGMAGKGTRLEIRFPLHRTANNGQTGYE